MKIPSIVLSRFYMSAPLVFFVPYQIFLANYLTVLDMIQYVFSNNKNETFIVNTK